MKKEEGRSQQNVSVLSGLLSRPMSDSARTAASIEQIDSVGEAAPMETPARSSPESETDHFDTIRQVHRKCTSWPTGPADTFGLLTLTLRSDRDRKAVQIRRCSQVAKAVDCKSTTRGFDSHRRLFLSRRAIVVLRGSFQNYKSRFGFYPKDKRS